MRVIRLLSLAAMWAGPALGQSPYILTTSTGPYPALGNPTGITLTSASPSLDPQRYGRATIPIGFSFPFYDKVYTSIVVTAHGIALFELNPTCTTCTYGYNSSLPNSYWPNGVIAPMWDDLKGSNPFSKVQYELSNGPQGKYLTIEWSDWNSWSATSAYSLTFQARLHESGVIELHYGNLSGSGYPLSAGAGIESPTGAQALIGKPCTNLPTAYCQLSAFTPNEILTFGPDIAPDLSVTALAIDGITQVGTDLVFDTTLGLRNFAQTAASGFTYRLFLSGNTTYEPAADIALSPAQQGPFTLAALGTASYSAQSTVPRPGSGSYYLIAVADDSNAVAESNETNNIGAIAAPLFAGVDLVALSISGPSSGGPGEPVTAAIAFANQGVDAAGAVGYQIWLSGDTTLGAGDHLVHSGSFTVSGGQSVSQSVGFNLPTNVPSGDYYFVLQLDDGPAVGSIPEVSETNNVKFGGQKFTSRQADVSVDKVLVLTATPPYELAEAAFFGEPIRLEVTISNVGGATASNLGVSFFLSDNETLNAINDPFVGEVTGLTLAPGATAVVALTEPVPAKSAAGVDLAPGDYYFFASASGSGFLEVSNANNIGKSALQRVRGPAPDLVATTLVGPATAAAGEAMVVARTFRNVGNRPSPQAAYRYYLSANAIVTEGDLPLMILTPAGEVSEGSVTLAVGQEDAAIDVVRIPPEAPPASYYLGVLLDPPGAGGSGQVLEISEANNGLATQRVAVAAAALHLSNPFLPDAVVGLPYEYALAAEGGSPPYAFALTGGTLPAVLSLSGEGRISGVPAESKTVGFTVSISDGSRNAEARLVLRALPATTGLSVTSRVLPPLVRLAQYEVLLAAQGGRAPYRWTLESGSLPLGLMLFEAGKLAGLPSGAVGTAYDFSLRVRDAAGSSDVAAYRLELVDSAALLIQSYVLFPGSVGSDYLADVIARNANGSPVARPVTWRVAAGQLPLGLSLEAAEEVALIRGTPARAGSYALTLQVEDATRRSDTADYVLVIHPEATSIRAQLPERVAPGERLSVQLSTSSGQAARWWLHNGELPRGLSLGEDGLLAGTVDGEARLGAYNFAVTAVTERGSRAMAALSLEVAEPGAERPKGCGCGAAPGALAWALVLCAAMARRGMTSTAGFWKGPRRLRHKVGLGP